MSLSTTAASIVDLFSDVVSARSLSVDPGAAVDGVPVRLVTKPATIAEAAAVVRRANEQGLAVVPRGAGTSMGLGNRPRRADVLLDLSALAAVVEHRPDDLVVTAQAGIRLHALDAALALHGRHVALEPWEGGARSLGGVLSTGDAGPLPPGRLGPRDHVLGVRFIQADGTLAWGGARVVKSVAGYDVPKLLVGSLGTLGIIVEATLRTQPRPPDMRSWSMGGGDGDAGALAAAVLNSTLAPRSIVYADVRPGAPTLTVTFAGPTAAVDAQGARLATLARAHGFSCDGVPADVWKRMAPALHAPLRLRLASRLPRVFAWTDRLIEGLAGVTLAGAVVDAAAGVARIGLLPRPDQHHLLRATLERLRAPLAAEGGHVVVERAPPDLKQTLDVWGPVRPGALAMMRRLKVALDPRSTLNPGRFVGGI